VSDASHVNVVEVVRDPPANVGDPRRDGDIRLMDWLKYVLHVSLSYRKGVAEVCFHVFVNTMAEFIARHGGNNLHPGTLLQAHFTHKH
jgi:hypothetical protein